MANTPSVRVTTRWGLIFDKDNAEGAQHIKKVLEQRGLRPEFSKSAVDGVFSLWLPQSLDPEGIALSLEFAKTVREKGGRFSAPFLGKFLNDVGRKLLAEEALKKPAPC